MQRLVSHFRRIFLQRNLNLYYRRFKTARVKLLKIISNAYQPVKYIYTATMMTSKITENTTSTVVQLDRDFSLSSRVVVP